MTEKKTTFEKLNEEQRAVSIPYYLHEGEMTRLERLNKKWFIAFLVVLVMLFITNGAWVVYEMQYETYYVTQDAQYDSTVTTSVLNNGTGRMVFNGDTREASPQSEGETGEQEQPDETMSNM